MLINNPKKAQAWGIDLIAGLMVFLAALAIFYTFSVNYSGDSDEIYEKMIYRSEILTDIILSEGYPEKWNKTNVETIGITDQGKINQTKLDYFYELAEDNYVLSKNLLDIEYDYFIKFDSNIKINNSVVEGIGKTGTDVDNIDSKNLIKKTRFSVYENKPCTVYIYIWD